MAVWTPSPPGYRGRPTRPYLARVERGNPVKVHDVFGCCGKPTVRRAEFRGGNRTPKKQMPAAERRQENGSVMAGPSTGRFRITGRIPGLVPGCESRLTCGG